MASTVPLLAHPWSEVELTLTAVQQYANGYTDVDVWADFTHDSGMTLRRPAFWDGGSTWKVRFASPLAEGRWTWHTFSSVDDVGLAGKTGTVTCEPGPGVAHRFYRHGFWRMSPGRRNLVHSNGRAAVLVGDTAWGLPWRATHEQCEVYARDRQAKGFNAVLLMSVQPDMDARGPRDRSADEGFDVGFEDLPAGHINQLNPAYFQYLDGLVSILVDHEIVPVFQPVFFGFGWKGLRVAGPVLPPEEYARYCRYLVARYGARPAIYLVGGDGTGREPQVAVGGEEVERWDAYRQPTGIHYRPHIVANAHQDAEWLDFQWCQTGHSGEHIPERVADMWRNEPVKGVANGEPTYEHGGKAGRAAGWWQGHEAWSNLCAGGTFGVVYGAGSLWQWAHRPEEPGQASFFLAPGAGWRQALDFEGSGYVGLVARILDGLPLADIAPNWEVTLGRRGLLSPGKLFIGYTEQGGDLRVFGDQVPLPYRVVDPRSGEVVVEGKRSSYAEAIPNVGEGPRVYICLDLDA
jgi:hypothetical protein